MKLPRLIEQTLGPKRTPAPLAKVRVENLTRGNLVAASVEVAGDSASRRKGLLGHTALAPEEGLWIFPCESVHTIGMAFPIDLIYLDTSRKVRKLCRNVPAWRFSICLSAHSILELAAGTIERTQVSVGDRLELLHLSTQQPEAETSSPEVHND
jgi:hypothetical protein